MLLQTVSKKVMEKASDRLAAVGYKVITWQGKLPRIVPYDIPRADPKQDTALVGKIFDDNIEGSTKITRA